MTGTSHPSVLPGVPGVLQQLTVRRLARSGITHLLVTLLALLDLLTSPEPAWPRTGALLGGAVLSAAALVSVGWAGVRRAGDDDPRGWTRWAEWAAVIPWAFGVGVFGLAGLRTLAGAGGEPGVLMAGSAYTLLGLRLLRDAVRVREVGRLGRFMAAPAPEETGRLGIPDR